MEYRNLGSSGVKVSMLCLGAMTFGEADEKSFMHKVGVRRERPRTRSSNRALERGHQLHRHRRRLRPGRPVRARRSATGWRSASARDKVVLATKFRFTHGRRARTARGASRYRIVACRRGQPAPAQDRSHRPLPDPHAGHRRRPRRRRCARSTISCAPARSSTSALATTRRTG